MDVPKTVSSSMYEYPTELIIESKNKSKSSKHFEYTEQIQKLTMKLTETESSYEFYKEKTETELVNLKERLRLAEENKSTENEMRS